MNKCYLLLDYDGYICKSWYASVNCEGDRIDNAERILLELERAALIKTMRYYPEYKEYIIQRVISGHTWKKDIYPSYKCHRKRDEELGNFREYIKIKYGKELIKVQQLEADDVLTILHEYYAIATTNHSIVFSDDKDLSYYTMVHSKINEAEPILEELDEVSMYKQMLAGDSEDDIKGIPNIGMKKADNLLSGNYTVDNVIQIYKDKELSIDECAKNLQLVIPLTTQFIEDGISLANEFVQAIKDKDVQKLDSVAMEMILEQCKHITSRITKIYNMNDKKSI